MPLIKFTSGVVPQLAHIGWGGFLTLLLLRWIPHWEAAAIVAAFAIAKESIEAIWGAWEAKQTWADSLLDMLFFFVGIALSWI
jgi:hypothetical protein